MNKLVEIKEFELITCNEAYKDNLSYKYINNELFEELETFILNIKSENDTSALEFFRISSKKNIGKVIQAKNYVGLIQMKNGFQIQVLPKIHGSGDDNLGFHKGKLIVNKHINKNLIHKERFYVEYDEFDINRPENRLIKATLLKLQNISSSSTNIKAIRQLLDNFELIKPSNNYTKDFSKVVINRNNKYYEDLMKWSKVFEAYVAKNLKSALNHLNWTISMQDKGYHLFDRPKQFALRPDIVITREDGSKIVLDSKWKMLNNNLNN